MADHTGIEWTDATWNPVIGCSIVSPGCTNCYAMKMAARIEKMQPASHYAGTTKRVNGHAVWTGKVVLAPDRILTEPLRWKRPRKIFVNSMGDLFHEDVPAEWIDYVFAVMALCPQPTFQVLTKRSKRMREYIEHLAACDWQARLGDTRRVSLATRAGGRPPWPLPNVWLGVSAEDQPRADERIPDLLATPAAIRFVSAEPLLGPIDFNQEGALWYYGDGVREPVKGWPDHPRRQGGLDWIITGGESGSDARPMHPDWARSIRDQCAAAQVPFFFKQWGSMLPAEKCRTDEDGTVWRRWPDGEEFWRLDERGKLDAPDIWFPRMSKKRAGRLLDGRTHNEFPEVKP